MKTNRLIVLTALALVLSGAQQAKALSAGNSPFANTDGTSRFSDPDEQYENMFNSNGVSLLPATSASSVSFSGMQQAVPDAPSDCIGQGLGCNCAGCRR
jgi:hypothetical protein